MGFYLVPVPVSMFLDLIAVATNARPHRVSDMTAPHSTFECLPDCRRETRELVLLAFAKLAEDLVRDLVALLRRLLQPAQLQLQRDHHEGRAQGRQNSAPSGLRADWLPTDLPGEPPARVRQAAEVVAAAHEGFQPPIHRCHGVRGEAHEPLQVPDR